MEAIKLLEPEINQNARDYINYCLDTGWLSYTGKYVRMLEELTRNYLDVKSATATGTATGGLWLTLKALDIKQGDFVIVPTMTFVATINSVIHTGATPVFVDCDDNLQMSTKYLAEAVKAIRSIVVVPVHMLGNIGDMDAIRDIVDTRKNFVIEDAAQALGSKDKNLQQAGTFGDASVFSYSFNKIVAAGQGGMVVSKRETLGDRVKYLSLQAKDDDEMYIHNEAGFNMGMSNVNAAIACAQMEDLDGILARKRHIRNKYAELLGKENMFYQEGSNGWLNAYKSREPYMNISRRLFGKKISTRPLFYPNHLQKSFMKYPYFGDNNSAEKHMYTICLPSSSNLTDEQIEYVVQSIRGD